MDTFTSSSAATAHHSIAPHFDQQRNTRLTDILDINRIALTAGLA